MVTLTKRETQKRTSSNMTDEFEKYLTEQRLKTTFNGIEVAEFSWYKKLFSIQ